MRLPHRPASRRGLTLTPLVDVVFILLFFLMLASQSLDWKRLDIELSAPARSAPIASAADVLTTGALAVLLLADGDLRWNGHVGSVRELRDELALAPGRTVTLVPGPGVPMQSLVDLVDALQDSDAVLRLGRAGEAPRAP